MFPLCTHCLSLHALVSPCLGLVFTQRCGGPSLQLAVSWDQLQHSPTPRETTQLLKKTVVNEHIDSENVFCRVFEFERHALSISSILTSKNGIDCILQHQMREPRELNRVWEIKMRQNYVDELNSAWVAAITYILRGLFGSIFMESAPTLTNIPRPHSSLWTGRLENQWEGQSFLQHYFIRLDFVLDCQEQSYW